MLEKLKEMISGSEADYIDIRYELKRETSAAVAGPELKKAGSSTTDGYVVRALKNGGFSSVTVTAESDVPEAVNWRSRALPPWPAEANSSLAPAEPCVDHVEPDLQGDPADVPLSEKISLLKKYNDLMLEKPEIANTNMSYTEVDREKFFVSSDGASIRERVCTVSIGGEVVARRATSHRTSAPLWGGKRNGLPV